MQRFWQNTIPIPWTGCFIWMGALSGKGSWQYGRFRTGERVVKAHRFAWELANGEPVPEGLHVLHKCDIPMCVNPAHLYVGTHTDNMRDAFRRDRIDRRGALNSKAKLSPEQVTRIRELYTAGITQVALARRFGVSQPQIGHIVRREHWK